MREEIDVSPVIKRERRKECVFIKTASEGAMMGAERMVLQQRERGILSRGLSSYQGEGRKRWHRQRRI